MKKYRLHTAGFILLALFALFINEFRKGTSLNRREIDFAVEDPGKIDEVKITGADGIVTLTRQDGLWILNSRFEARAQAVEMLLQTFTRLRVSSPAPLFVSEQIMGKMADQSLRVEIRMGRRRRTYFVYSEGDGSPAYMMMEGSSRPYTVEVVGFGADVASLFVSEESYWRTNILFSYRLNDISEVLVHHREDEDGSFLLSQSPDREFSLCSYPEGEVVEGVSDSLAVRFLANFIYVPYERMADRSESLLLDSLVTAGHDHLIRVTGRDGTVSEVSLNRIVADRGAGEDQPRYDLFRLYALINNRSEIAVVPYQSVDLILRSSSYFTREGDR